ncbi:MAG: IS1634 family transposase, partial [Verrucomicrobia bacterium]|nr:IS1634 family transposase [Verrucomicrobiota bacterium]
MRSVLKARQYEFDVERAIYLTVLHRLFASGSDRGAERWREDYLIPGTEALELHHLYRAMAFLGDAVEQLEKPTGAVRCNKDFIEESLFERRRDLFTEVELIFFDTTSLHFEGRGGESIGQRGHTKDHRPDLKQMIVGMAVDVEGRPICCEMWPGNTADVTTLLPVVKRMRERFRIREITIVADRGMVSQATLEAFENSDPPVRYVVGVRMRGQKEVSISVLGSRAHWFESVPERSKAKDPAPLKVKEVWVEDRCYVVCLNEEQGASIPLPYGGKTAAVSVDLEPDKLQAYSIAPQEVANAINQQSVVLPSGTAKIGIREYDVLLNESANTVQALNNLPIKKVNGTTIYIRDVANVRDGYTPQVSMIASNGVKAALLPVLKNGDASTLDVVSRVRKELPQIAATLPQELQIKPLFDQSVFVSSALDGVLREGSIAALLTALMILLFLGSWRSTLVVATSIPLSICFSVLALHLNGQTINIMTLGGLALAVGILVDDATVEIENIHRNLAMGKSMIDAILDGAQEIATPAFVATLSICIVFVPIFLLGGVAYYLFAPLAMAVVFAMLASYFLSRTVVPTMVNFLLKNEHHGQDSNERKAPRRNWFLRIHEGFNRGFEKLRNFYAARLQWALNHGRLVIGVMLTVVVLSLGLVTPFLGEDFFPKVDAGQFRLHVSAPVGTRIEETQQVFYQIENVIRSVIPKNQIDLIIQNIGLPMNLNLAL